MSNQPYQKQYDRWQESVTEFSAARDSVQLAVAERNLDTLDTPMRQFESAKANMAQAFEELWMAYKATMSDRKKVDA